MTSPRGDRLRAKIAAVLASLVALWSFAAYVTVRDGASLLWFATLEQQVAKPVEAVVAAVQAERRESVVFAANGLESDATPLHAARAQTDQAVRAMRTALSGTLARWSEQGDTPARLADFDTALNALGETRSGVDDGRLGRGGAADSYNYLINLAQAVYTTFTVWDDAGVIAQTSTLLKVTQTQELISEEDALLAGVIADKRFTDTNRAEFTALVGAQRYLVSDIVTALGSDDRQVYDTAQAGPALVSLRAIEDRVVAAPAGAPPIADAAAWRTTVNDAIATTRDVLSRLTDSAVSRVRGPAVWIVVRLILAAGLGLIAVIASIRFSLRTARRLAEQLAALRAAALDLAEVRLPAVVARLDRGEDIDLADAAPPLAAGDDDIGRLGHAFNAVQDTAIRATVGQARMRQGVRDVFLNLARRSQALLHRQLKLIDAMERSATTEAQLAELYRVDHLATRMRRNAENLIVLSGAVAGRAWRAPVPMMDVLRGALGEVEDYPRVNVPAADPAALAGRAVADVIHLLAELMENAVSFSPPNTHVIVSGQRVAAGYVIEIEDRGLGMSPADMLAANRQLADPPDFQLSSTARLGFYVVGRLAQRHGIAVRLKRSPYDGTTAVVLLPPELFTNEMTPPPVDRDANGSRPTAAVPIVVSPARSFSGFFATGGGMTPAPASAPVVAEIVEVSSTADTDPGIRLTTGGLPMRVRKDRGAGGRVDGGDRRPSDYPINGTGAAAAAGWPASPHRTESAGRDPEQVRRFMNAYQSGIRRGIAAARADQTSDRGDTP